MLPILAPSVRRHPRYRPSSRMARSVGVLPATTKNIVVPVFETVQCESGKICQCTDGNGKLLPFQACDCDYGCKLQTDPKKEFYGSCVCK